MPKSYEQYKYTAQGEFVYEGTSNNVAASATNAVEGFVDISIPEISLKKNSTNHENSCRYTCNKYSLTYIPDSYNKDSKTCGCDIKHNEAYVKLNNMTLGGDTLDTVIHDLESVNKKTLVTRCQEDCHATPDCKGFVVNKTKTTCWLKDSIDNSTPSRDTSYIRKSLL